ncbi:MAG: hypothetical protein ACRDQZ_22075, partial [Mycobacteriales bacterium]
MQRKKQTPPPAIRNLGSGQHASVRPNAASKHTVPVSRRPGRHNTTYQHLTMKPTTTHHATRSEHPEKAEWHRRLRHPHNR